MRYEMVAIFKRRGFLVCLQHAIVESNLYRRIHVALMCVDVESILSMANIRAKNFLEHPKY